MFPVKKNVARVKQLVQNLPNQPSRLFQSHVAWKKPERKWWVFMKHAENQQKGLRGREEGKDTEVEAGCRAAGLSK